MLRRFVLTILMVGLLSLTAHADINFNGGGGGGGGGGAPTVQGQSVVNGQGTVRNDASMIAGPVGTSGVNVTTLSAPSFTTDVTNAVVFNVYGTSTTTNAPPSVTNLVNIASSAGQNMGLWAGFQTVSNAASGAQAIGFAGVTGAGAVTIPFMPVTGQTIGVSSAASRLQTATAAGGTTITISVPSATANGDTLLACEAWYPNAGPTAIPPSQPVPATGTQRWVNDGTWYTISAQGGGIQCWHKTASTEPASYSFPTTSSGTGVPSGFIADLTNVQNLDVPMTSATGTFTAGNVGNDLCIQGADTSFFYSSDGAGNSVAGQGCGQIGVFSSATKIYPNFGNVSNATLSGKQYMYGPDQGAAIQSAINGLTTGGTVVLGSGIYMVCGGNNTSTCITFPANAPIVLQGQGRALSNWGFAGGLGGLGPGTGINNTNLGTYIDVANTDLNQSAMTYIGNANAVIGTIFSLYIRDLAIWAGVGTSGDGGGAAGFTAQNFQWLSMDRVMIGNFLGDIVDTIATGATGYTDATYFNQAWFTLSGNGDGWKSIGGQSGAILAQNEVVLESEIDNNAFSGVELQGPHDSLDFYGNNIQRNDNFNKGGSRYEIFCNSCTAVGVVQGNYFENDATFQNANISNQTAGWAGTLWNGNFSVGTFQNGVSAPQFFPTSSSYTTPQHFRDTTPGAGKTFGVPNGTTSLHVCVGGGGGGGGAATTGGAAALAGGSGGSGGYYCVDLSGAALNSAITYTVGAGGAAGTCSATPTASGSGNQSSISVGGVSLGNANNANPTGGGTASTTVNGTAGTGSGVPSLTTAVMSVQQVSGVITTAGHAGSAGSGDAFTVPGYTGGGQGGQGYGVTAGGACDGSIVATPGGNGWAEFTAYFN